MTHFANALRRTSDNLQSKAIIKLEISPARYTKEAYQTSFIQLFTAKIQVPFAAWYHWSARRWCSDPGGGIPREITIWTPVAG